jgi:hypothetical protein
MVVRAHDWKPNGFNLEDIANKFDKLGEYNCNWQSTNQTLYASIVCFIRNIHHHVPISMHNLEKIFPYLGNFFACLLEETFQFQDINSFTHDFIHEAKIRTRVEVAKHRNFKRWTSSNEELKVLEDEVRAVDGLIIESAKVNESVNKETPKTQEMKIMEELERHSEKDRKLEEEIEKMNEASKTKKVEKPGSSHGSR